VQNDDLSLAPVAVICVWNAPKVHVCKALSSAHGTTGSSEKSLGHWGLALKGTVKPQPLSLSLFCTLTMK
jgi:hypothetical protein